MAAPTIPNGEEHFFNIIYEGNGAGQRVGNFVPFTDSGVISNSCIFNGATAQARVGRTPSSNGSGTILTFSAWVKRGRLGSISSIFIANDYASVGEALEFNTSNQLNYYCIKSSPGSYDWNYITNRTFEDTSKWYHIYVRRDTTDSTAADRVQIYIDGEKVTSWNTETQAGSNQTGWMNQTTYENSFGNTNNASYVRGIGYLAEINMIDGSNPAISTFGLTDTSTGRWIPKSLTGITYGTNGFRLQFGSPSAIGDDTSGNNNDLSVHNLVASDLTTDSPTQNHTTLNTIKNSNITLSEGNLKAATVSGGQGYVSGSQIPLTSGKYYSEITITTAGSTLFFLGVGNFDDYLDHYTEDNPVSKIAGGYIRSDNGQAYTSNNDAGAYHTYGNSFTTNDVIGIAIDVDKGAMWISKNGTWQNSATASEIADGDTSNSLRTGMKGPLIILNYTHSGTTVDYNFGQRSFSYTAPTGYNSIQQDNLPETSKGISGFVWMKNRDATDNHQLYDSSRGKQKAIFSNTTDVQATVADGLQKFLVGGQQIEDDVSINTSGESYVSWNWNANAGTTASNGNGSITSVVQANQTAGFSIVRYTGTGSAATVGHGLSSAPEWIFGRPETLSGGYHWSAYHKSMTSASYYLSLNQNIGETSNSDVWGSAPTSSVINLGVSMSNSSQPIILYCWHSVDGFSKFGKYTGNGVADGPFVYTGFKPAWLLVKANNAANWYLCDAARSTMNPVTTFVHPDRSDADYSNFGRGFDFLSNGFKVRQESGYGANYSGVVTFYMAFAKHPFVGDGTNPVTAR
jgi:hypothetical protein